MMTLKELVRACVTDPAIQAYALLAVAGLALAARWGGAPLRLLAPATGLITTCCDGFCHCIQHLPFALRQEWLRRIKRYRLAHHFHSERGNCGTTNYFWDRALGTFYPEPKAFPLSETVLNLGYTGPGPGRFPWVARLAGLEPDEPVLRRGRPE